MDGNQIFEFQENFVSVSPAITPNGDQYSGTNTNSYPKNSAPYLYKIDGSDGSQLMEVDLNLKYLGASLANPPSKPGILLAPQATDGGG